MASRFHHRRLRSERRGEVFDRAMRDLVRFNGKWPYSDRDLGVLATTIARLHAAVAGEVRSRLSLDSLPPPPAPFGNIIYDDADPRLPPYGTADDLETADNLDTADELGDAA
jgi:hypothetical protein